MSKNLMAACNQWATRPLDQMFPSMASMLEATAAHYVASKEITEDLGASKVIVGEDGNLKLSTDYKPSGYDFSYWGFSQFCRNVNSNANYMRTLDKEPERAAHNLNKDIYEKGTCGDSILYVRGDKLLSSTSTKYARLPNCIMVKHIMDACPTSDGWKLPPARPPVGMAKNDPRIHLATAEEIGTSSRMEVGDACVSAGCYASDEDSFVFLINEKLAIEDGSNGGLHLGFFARNSEVGKNAFSLTTFLFREVCGNIIVWDATRIKKTNIKHIGNNIVGRVGDTISSQISSYLKFDLGLVENRIKRAKQILLGNTVKEVTDILFANKSLKLSKNVIKSSLDLAEQNRDIDGDPRSIYGFVNGLTRHSQTMSYQSDRDDLDVVSAQILAFAN